MVFAPESVSHRCKSVFSGLSVCGDQQNPYVEVSKTLKIKTGSPRLIEGSAPGYNTPISIIALKIRRLRELEDQISGAPQHSSGQSLSLADHVMDTTVHIR